MIFNRDSLNRIRMNTIKSQLVYFPIIFSLYDNFFINQTKHNDYFNSINSDMGYWRHFGYGMFSIYKSDFDRIGGFNKKFIGWGQEDYELFSRIKASNLSIMRTTDQGLVHLFHKFDCDSSKTSIQITSCRKSKARTVASQRVLTNLIYSKIYSNLTF
ncbi:unnamed protein product [Brachionus calyciflorus]|uniref:Hexosyltransferase n=1 Tax=Brachionus calyciflorus TaxID=104777 RepID=A0A814GTG5_9BILA|nr:unnamed protein product [Brachionus calyciflorus]